MTQNKFDNRVKAFVEQKMQDVARKDAGIKAPVSMRLNIVAVATLDTMAEMFGDTRTNLAASLLNAAIQDACDSLNFAARNTPEFLEQIKPALDKLFAKYDEELSERGE